jgi:hypothetical protein
MSGISKTRAKMIVQAIDDWASVAPLTPEKLIARVKRTFQIDISTIDPAALIGNRPKQPPGDNNVLSDGRSLHTQAQKAEIRNIEREIQTIKTRLDNIENFLAGNRIREGPRTVEDESDYELTNLEVKKAQGLLGPEYAYKLTVKNNSKTSTQFTGKIIFLDHSEFEVTSGPIDFFTVAADSTFTKTGREIIMNEDDAARIANVTAEIFPV